LKLVLYICIFISILTSSLNATTQSFSVDNDAFISSNDSHYTNGIFYTFMGDLNSSIDFEFMNDLQTNSAISFTHLIFTPEDKNVTTPILDDLPYSGYMELNFLLYKYTKNYFHEFGINLGMVGPVTKAKEIQSNFHTFTNNAEPKGWDTQLKNKITAGLSYNFAKKTDKRELKSLEYDWTNNFRLNVGTFYSGVLLSSTFRFGNNLLDTFATTGNFIGGNESALLNFKKSKTFNWSISFGIFANRVFNYYLIDEALKQGHTLPKIDYISGEQVSYDIFYKNFQYTFKIKSIYLRNNKFLSRASKQWGGVSITWQY